MLTLMIYAIWKVASRRPDLTPAEDPRLGNLTTGPEISIGCRACTCGQRSECYPPESGFVRGCLSGEVAALSILQGRYHLIFE
jgi:hypothetical protein